MTRKTYKLSNDQVRQSALDAVKQAPDGYIVEVKQDTRTIAQNRLLWALLNDLSRQVKWQVNGYETMLSPHDWKDIATASAHQESRISQGFKGGLVMLGKSTRVMNRAQFSDLVNTILEFGFDHDVIWSDQQGVNDWQQQE